MSPGLIVVWYFYLNIVTKLTILTHRAYNNIELGSITMASTLLFDANINRSPTSYLLNPQSERDEYASEGDTDKTMLQINFSNEHGDPIGILNWFAVHATSMNASNLVRNENAYRAMLHRRFLMSYFILYVHPANFR